MNDFTPRLRSTVYPTRRRAVMWQGKLMRPANGVEVLLYGRSPTAGKPFAPLNARSQRIAPGADSARVAPTAKQRNASDPSAFIPL